ncbi:glycosyltransferase family 2 protein [Brevibacillus sp. SYSU BS000544]|uniref:glycosyltransferase family 2 protein n=1 Tax=Brevibacillus sp. SYSU BS000544 TaxID=3416443 RepID=UPI003CE4837A
MADIGIVMPVYKQHPVFLQKAIRSILNQKYRYFKLVIVIDGTTPNVVKTVRRVAQRDPRVEVIAYRKNQGTAYALNRGFGRFQNNPGIQYVTWVSSDNVYYPSFLLTLRQNLITAPASVGLVYSNSRFITNKGRPVFSRSRLLRQRQWRAQPKENLIDSCFIGASFMYKKSIALLTGEYRLTPVEDYDYWLRLSEHCDLKYLPIELMDYRLRSTYSMSRKLRTQPQVYRRKRYISQLIRLEARMRRSIPVETTVLILWNHRSRAAIKRLETLFEQTYYNFNCFVIDQTPNASFASVLKRIPDPRVTHFSMPFVPVQEAIRHVLLQTESPFVMVYALGKPLHKQFLTGLVNLFRARYPYLLSIHHADSTIHLSAHLQAQPDPYYQAIRTARSTLICRSIPLPAEPHFLHLYHLPKLVEALNR